MSTDLERIYLDSNATTAAAPEVVEALVPWLREHCGNPSSLHAAGSEAAGAVSAARAALARLIGAAGPREIVFTSGGTESINTAICSALGTGGGRERVLTSTAEHAATLRPLEARESEGLELYRAGVDDQGRLQVDALLAQLDERCALVTLLLANNETGVLLAQEDAVRIGEACRAAGALFHLDAVQVVGKLPLDLRSMPVDLVSISAHKFHGPKGVGALYVRRGTSFKARQLGGPQERDRRAGTLNTPGIVGLGRAAELAREYLRDGERGTELARLRDRLEGALLERVPGAAINGGAAARLPNTASVRFEGVSGEALVMLLSELGLCCSTGSACSSERMAPSHVLLAMGLRPEQAGSTLRLSLSRETGPEEVEQASLRIADAVQRLRDLAPAP